MLDNQTVFLTFWWEGGNPFPKARIESWKTFMRQTKGADGDAQHRGIKRVQEGMKRVLRERYNDGNSIPLGTAIAVGSEGGPFCSR